MTIAEAVKSTGAWFELKVERESNEISGSTVPGSE
jgi:hypothetical protein